MVCQMKQDSPQCVLDVEVGTTTKATAKQKGFHADIVRVKSMHPIVVHSY